ncbi:MAG TPA: hypothetical protein VFP63_03235 [Dehalococcoidia bacterium]|nr:hypothetical protein [Dehalococcoidia bacterium]
MRNTLLALAISLALLLPVAHDRDAEARVPHSATTVTNVCLVYSVDGIYSGGVPVAWPATISYRYVGPSGGAFLWLPSGERLRVEYLSITPLSPDNVCIGIV